jgi:polar amino acid transport system permease protein
MIDLRLIASDVPFILWGMPLTLGIALSSFALGAFLSVPFAYIALARVPVARHVIGGWVQFFTVTPSLVHITWVYYVVPIAFGLKLSAVEAVILALRAETSAYLSVILRSGIQAVPGGQWKAAAVRGLSGWQRALYVVLPRRDAAARSAPLRRARWDDLPHVRTIVRPRGGPACSACSNLQSNSRRRPVRQQGKRL